MSQPNLNSPEWTQIPSTHLLPRAMIIKDGDSYRPAAKEDFAANISLDGEGLNFDFDNSTPRIDANGSSEISILNGQVFAVNSGRYDAKIINMGTGSLRIYEGTIASGNFVGTLAPGLEEDDGFGGVYSANNGNYIYQGAISVTGESPRYLRFER